MTFGIKISLLIKQCKYPEQLFVVGERFVAWPKDGKFTLLMCYIIKSSMFCTVNCLMRILVCTM